MAKKAALVTIHGMGETPRDYAAPLFDDVKRRLGAKADDLHLGSIYYKHLLQVNEERVWRRMADKVRWDALRKFVLYGFADALGLETGKESRGSDYANCSKRAATSRPSWLRTPRRTSCRSRSRTRRSSGATSTTRATCSAGRSPSCPSRTPRSSTTCR